LPREATQLRALWLTPNGETGITIVDLKQAIIISPQGLRIPHIKLCQPIDLLVLRT